MSLRAEVSLKHSNPAYSACTTAFSFLTAQANSPENNLRAAAEKSAARSWKGLTRWTVTAQARCPSARTLIRVGKSIGTCTRRLMAKRDTSFGWTRAIWRSAVSKSELAEHACASCSQGSAALKKPPTAENPSQLISKRIAELGDWRGETLRRMRELIR